MSIEELKEIYYPRILDVIPVIVTEHINEMHKYPQVHKFILEHPKYKTDLATTFRLQAMALFLPEEEYWPSIHLSEKEGFELGKIFARDPDLSLELVLKLTNSTRIWALRKIVELFEGNTLEPGISRLIERVFELSNYRQNAFFNGFIFVQSELLRNQSITDPLTNVYNRRYFYERVIEEMKRAYRIEYPLTLMLIDLNNLKQVNDEQGHLEGDNLLRYFTKIVSKIRSNFDSVFRFGGDEFVLLLPNCTEANAEEIGTRLNVELTSYNPKSSLSFGTVSIPLVENPENINVDQYIKIADERMYELKNHLKYQK